MFFCWNKLFNCQFFSETFTPWIENLSWINVFFYFSPKNGKSQLNLYFLTELFIFSLKLFSVNGKSQLDLCLSEMLRQSSPSCANWQFTQLLLHKTFLYVFFILIHSISFIKKTFFLMKKSHQVGKISRQVHNCWFLFIF